MDLDAKAKIKGRIDKSLGRDYRPIIMAVLLLLAFCFFLPPQSKLYMPTCAVESYVCR